MTNQDRVQGDTSKEDGCFLCAPEDALIYWREKHVFAMAGLGPVVEGYSVVAHEGHIPSMADVPQTDVECTAAIVAKIRRELTARYRSCVITEHGRFPICDGEVAGYDDPHCYHAHFLVFPGAPNPVSYVRSYFREAAEFTDLQAALEHAHGDEEYFLFSPSRGSFFVMTGGLNLPRQFARCVIAISMGRPELADWRRTPNRDDALNIASHFRDNLSQVRSNG